MKAGLAAFRATAARGDRLAVVTAYDATFARLVVAAGVDAILVGDSVGNVVAGFDSTLPVTLRHMIYHAAAVRRGAPDAFVIADMPFLTYRGSRARAMRQCGRLVQASGADAVKLEGGDAAVARTIGAIVAMGVPVMGHVGHTPQTRLVQGWGTVQGRAAGDADRLVAEARRLEQAGAFALVLELVVPAVAARVTEAVAIPTIGIGAGPHCGGQVLVLPDLLGLDDAFHPRFVKRYAELADTVRSAVRTYVADVRAGTYPDADHSF